MHNCGKKTRQRKEEEKFLEAWFTARARADSALNPLEKEKRQRTVNTREKVSRERKREEQRASSLRTRERKRLGILDLGQV